MSKKTLLLVEDEQSIADALIFSLEADGYRVIWSQLASEALDTIDNEDIDLIILPIDGVLHTVQPGDTLERVAAEFNANVEDIIAYEPNNLEFPSECG